jgi:hypothetical protein
MSRKQWLLAWRTYREAGFRRSAVLDGKDVACLCSEINTRRNTPPFPFASLRDRLQCYTLKRGINE